MVSMWDRRAQAKGDARVTEIKPPKPGAKGCKGCGRVLYVTDPDYCPDCADKAPKPKPAPKPTTEGKAE